MPQGKGHPDEQGGLSVADATTSIDSVLESVQVYASVAGAPTSGKLVNKNGHTIPLESLQSVVDVYLTGIFDVIRHCVNA